jgi:predicted protein tyrosine phosphatase
MIRIMSRRQAQSALIYDPNIPIIAIGETFGHEVEDLILSKARNYICAKFDDVELERPGYSVATEDQIKQIIEWAKDKDDIIVACRAGISRSSAVAYLVESSKRGPEEAIKILDMAWHQPNPTVVKVGSKILGEQVNEVFQKWRRELLTKLVQGLY